MIVQELIQWDCSKIYLRFDQESVVDILKIHLPSTLQMVVFLWTPNSNGYFSTNSTYWMVSENFFGSGPFDQRRLEGLNFCFENYIGAHSQPKQILNSRLIMKDLWLLFCEETDETSKHLFVKYSLTR